MNNLLTFLKSESCWDRIAVSEDEIPDAYLIRINYELVGVHEDLNPVL